MFVQNAEYQCSDSDIVAVGLQEAPMPFTAIVGFDPLCDIFATVLSKMDFVLLNHNRVSIAPGSWGILTMLFLKRPLLCYCRKMKLGSVRTGMGGLIGNKGAAIIKFDIGDFTLCFVNCHLPPHEENNQKRLQDLKFIFGEPCIDNQAIDLYDSVFLFGDLNFRLEGVTYDDAIQAIKEKQYKELLAYDQLIIDQKEGSPSGSQLMLYLEGEIEFQPSYKFEPLTDNYTDPSKGRVPSWCDRILWSLPKRLMVGKMDSSFVVNRLHQQSYCLCQEPKLSDHRAVSAHFTLQVDLSAPPSVIFEPTSWVRGRNAAICFEVVKDTQVSTWDWIALYPRCFSSIQKDYLYWTYSPARTNEKENCTYKVLVPSVNVPQDIGYFMFLYYSRVSSSAIGMSPLFHIK